MLEQVLERIAVALEKIAANIPGGETTAAPAAEPVKRAGRPPKVTPAAAPEAAAPVQDDPFATEEPPVTFEAMSETLKKHAKTFGSPVTIELMKKHGADAAAPKLASIPQANWSAVTKAAQADLDKGAKK